MYISLCKLFTFTLHVCFLLQFTVQSDTDLPISHSFSNVELFIAYLCIHYNHLTSIRFNSGDMVERNTRCIRGWHLDRAFFTLLDLCIGTLSNTKNICLMLSSYFWYSFYEIKELFSCLLFIGVYQHLIISMVVNTKHV